MYDDKAAIIEVINLYSIALDSHGWDLFDAIFTPDAELHYANMLHWTDLASFKAAFTEMHESTFGHQHFLGVPQIVVDGDRAWALTYGRFNLFRVTPAVAAEDMSAGGAWYDDELVRTAAGWRIARRTANNFWWQGTPGEADAANKRIVDPFPQLARDGNIGFINALRRQMANQAQVPEAAAE